MNIGILYGVTGGHHHAVAEVDQSYYIVILQGLDLRF